MVARVEDIPAGERKVFSVRGRSIVLFNHSGEFFVILDRCPHEGAPLSKGSLISLVESDDPGVYKRSRPGEVLKCPWHGWEFDIRTGRSWCDPASTKAKKYPVSVEPGCALAKGPFVADTFPVSLEDNYVIVEKCNGAADDGR